MAKKDKKYPLPPVFTEIQKSENMVLNLDEDIIITSMSDFDNMSYNEMIEWKLDAERKDKPKKLERQTVTYVTGTNTNKWQQLEEVSNQLDGGPYHMGGRDNTLTIHPSKASGSILFSYEYQGGEGELLSFDVDTDYTMSISEVTQTSDIDPEDKTIITETNQVVPNTDAMYQEGEVNIWQEKPKWQNPYYKTGGSMPQDNTLPPPTQPMLVIDSTKPKSRPIQQAVVEGVFPSVKEATKQIGETYEPDIVDVEKYQEQAREFYRKVENPENEEEYRNQISSSKLPDFHLTKRVTVESRHHPAEFTARDRSGGKSGANYSNTKRGRAEARREGLNYLKKSKEYQIIDDDNYGYVILRRVVEVEVPIPGIKLLASYAPNRSSRGSVNDMIRNVQSKIEANAQIIGNPLLESSMNVEIKNVSERYSGVWYSKEVIHTIDNSGYTCGIEFIQKSLPVSISHVKGVIPLVKAYDAWTGLTEEAKKSLDSGQYMARVSIETAFEEWKKQNNIKGQFLVRSRPDDPFTGDIYNASNDMRSAVGKPIATVTGKIPTNE